MVELLALLAIVIIIGALAGGDSFGEVIRTGFGCLGVLLVLAVIGLAVLLIP
ncbi:MAG: hypothetical protein RI542_08485 [Wenzhouxiangella sp.]|nr:hypothetical protein [Wenzhouxiangella sp.]